MTRGRVAATADGSREKNKDILIGYFLCKISNSVAFVFGGFSYAAKMLLDSLIFFIYGLLFRTCICNFVVKIFIVMNIVQSSI